MIDEEKLDKVLRLAGLGLPPMPKVTSIEWEPYVDSTGDDALNVLVVLENDTVDADRTWEKLEPIESTIRTALLKAGVELWPYFSFRTRQEMKELEDEDDEAGTESGGVD